MNEIRFDEDWHVHSTFSDGTATIEENVRAAEARDLSRLCLVDHVRASTDWVEEFVSACRAVSVTTPVRVRCGVEAKLLDTSGRLDAPAEADLADHILAADHQLPTPEGPMHPDLAREKLETGALSPAQITEWLVRSSANAVLRYDNVILAHPFSILPKLGLDHRDLNPALVHWLGSVIAGRGACTEVSERWQCPAPWVAAEFLRAGATVHASTDSHALATLGRYEWCRQAVAEIDAAQHSPSSLVA